MNSVATRVVNSVPRKPTPKPLVVHTHPWLLPKGK